MIATAGVPAVSVASPAADPTLLLSPLLASLSPLLASSISAGIDTDLWGTERAPVVAPAPVASFSASACADRLGGRGGCRTVSDFEVNSDGADG